MKLLRIVAVSGVLALSAASAHAQITSYTDAAWTAAFPGATLHVIPDVGAANFQFFGAGDASVTYGDVTYSTSSALGDGNFFNVSSGFSGDPAVLSSQEQTIGVANILISLPNFVNAFALDYGTFGGSDVTFTLSNGDVLTQGSTGSGYATPDLLRISDGVGFNTVLVTSTDGVMDVNNAAFIERGAVPEPATWAMMLLGFGGLGAMLRSRRKAALAAA